jgi:hypothetical protein
MFKITRKRMAGISLALTMVLVLVLATTAMAEGRVILHVSAGGPDSCTYWGVHPGCDANFSLTVNMYADGSVSGEFTDRSVKGGGTHSVINCLVVEGKTAWVSGVVTQGTMTDYVTGEKVDVTGWPIATKVRDNGTSANDPPDQINYSWVDPNVPPCTTKDTIIPYENFMMDAAQGQVTVK